MIEELVNSFNLWYKPNELKPNDINTIKCVFIYNSFVSAYQKGHNLADYDYVKADVQYKQYFNRKIIILNLLRLLCYIYYNIGGEDTKIKESIRDNELEKTATRIQAIKGLIDISWQKVAMYIYQSAVKENIFKIDSSREAQVNLYLKEGVFDLNKFRGYNKIFSNTERTCIKNFILCKPKLKIPSKDFLERDEVISEILHILNILISCYNSKNITVLNQIKNDEANVGRDRLLAIKLLEQIRRDRYKIDSYAPPVKVGDAVEVKFKNDDQDKIDWGDDDDDDLEVDDSNE